MRSMVSTRRALVVLGLALAGATAAAVATTVPASAQTQGVVQWAGDPAAVGNSYIVVLKGASTSVDTAAKQVAGRHGGAVRQTYDAALRGFEVSASATAARAIAADKDVAYVEQNRVVQLDATQTNPPSWGLDRIDQVNLPLNNSYTYPTTASGVHAYIIDTGIRTTHTTFGGRASAGFDAVTSGGSANDGNGHGTHVAGTVGGMQYGVAKGVQLVAVRVLNNQGSGTVAQVVAGINWVTSHAIKPAVANMSLGGGVSASIDNAVVGSINSGVTYAIAAGNSNANACNSSPARVAAAITVGATQSNDARASFSNIGTCVDIFAPGVGITSSWRTSDTATNTISGTSMATPHVTGAAALYLSLHPGSTPAQVAAGLVSASTKNVVGGAGTGSPNRLLFVSQT